VLAIESLPVHKSAQHVYSGSIWKRSCHPQLLGGALVAVVAVDALLHIFQKYLCTRPSRKNNAFFAVVAEEHAILDHAYLLVGITYSD